MLEQFFSGILHQLQGEVDLINALVPHNATKGDLNEQSLKRILASFLPNRYAIGSGFVVDSFGARSKQVDIVVYDAIYSTKLFNATSRSEEHTSELQSPCNLVCRLLLEKKKQPETIMPI